jgi:hypothetical protein
MDKESGIRKRSTKGNTRERIRRGGHQQKKITKTAKVRVLYSHYKCSGLKKRRILRLREKILDSRAGKKLETWVEEQN